MSKQRNPIYVTTPGTLLYPHLTKPDTAYNADGIFSAKIILTPSAKRDEIVKLIDVGHEDSIRAALKENPKLKRETIKVADKPYCIETDPDGNNTGNIILYAKMKALVKPKDGDPWSQSPALFDAMNNKIDPTTINPWSGTLARISFEIIMFYTALIGAGVTLRLKAAQILTLVEGGGRSAEDYGFEPDEEYGASQREEGNTEDKDLPF